MNLSHGPEERSRHPAIRVTLWSSLGIIILVLVLQINRRITSGHSGDFRHFYFAAGALLDHRDLYGPVPIDIVERGLRRPARPVEQAWYTTDQERYLYPPLIAMLYTPIARLRFETAQRVILATNATLIVIGILLISRSFAQRFELQQTDWLIPAAALLGTIINLDKVHVELQMFQTNALMFCMFAVSLYWLDRRPILAGIPLGLILNIKYLSIGLLPWLILRRRWGTAISCILSTLVFAFLPAVFSGWQANFHNLTIAYGGLLQMIGIHSAAEQANVDDIRDYLSCSITSAVARTTAHGQSLVIPMIASASIAIFAALIVVAIYRRKRIPIFAWPLFSTHAPSLTAADFSPQSVPREQIFPSNKEPQRINSTQSQCPWEPLIAIEFVSILAATLCFSPQTNTRHLVLALLLTIPLAMLILNPRATYSKTWPVAGALLIGIGFIFPPGGQAPASHRLALWWFGIGGQCWCLLIAMFTLQSGSGVGVPPMQKYQTE